MNWHVIWEAIKDLIAGLKEVKRWKMSVDGKRTGEITSVTVGETGIKFAFTLDGESVTLATAAGLSDHAAVKINGKVDDDARLVFSLRHQPFKPLIVVLEFKNVTLAGAEHRIRFDNPK